MTTELIEKINSQVDSWNEGIFVQPTGIPTYIKEHVIYLRWEVGRYAGGSCWGGRARWYEGDGEPDSWKTLDLVLENLFPNISYSQYKKLITLEYRCDGDDLNEYEYYGNSTEYACKYIILSELENFIANETLQN